MKQSPNSYLPSTTTVLPTKKQRELLSFISSFIGAHGYSPSYREIMSGLGYNSVATVALHVGNLIKRGHVRKRDRSARSLEVVESSVADFEENSINPSEEKWLVARINKEFLAAEQLASEEGSVEMDHLYVLVGALKVLGLDEAARSFMPRLSELENK